MRLITIRLLSVWQYIVSMFLGLMKNITSTSLIQTSLGIYTGIVETWETSISRNDWICVSIYCSMNWIKSILYSIVSGHEGTITDLQWSPSGSNLLSVDKNGVFKLWGMKVHNLFIQVETELQCVLSLIQTNSTFWAKAICRSIPDKGPLFETSNFIVSLI